MRPLHRARARLQRLAQQEEGYVALWTALLVVGLFTLAGLVYDGASRGSAARRAVMVANEAARAADQELTAEAITGQQAQVDPARGAAAARDYLAAAGVHGSVVVEGDTVRITTSLPWSPSFTPLPAKAVTGSATATTHRT